MRKILQIYRDILHSDLPPDQKKQVYQYTKLHWRQKIRPLVYTHFWAFCEYVIRDEKTNDFIELQEFHVEWCDLFQSGEHLVLFSPCETGKSTLVSVAYPLWRLGLDPSLRIAIVSNTASQATKFLSQIKRYIESSQEYHEVFPHVRPAPHPSIPKRHERWSDVAIIIVRPTFSKDPSVQALGVAGPLLSSRLDLLILDDVLDQDNTESDAKREKVIRWHDSTARNRLVDEGQEIIIGTAWSESPPDLMHYLEGKGEYKTVRYSLEEEDTADGYHFVSWPEKFPKEKLERDKLHNPIEYNRQRRCRVTSREERIFEGHFEKAVGEFDLPEGNITFAGMDLSTSKRAGTVIATVACWQGGKAVIDIEYGAWSAEEKVEALTRHYEKHHPRVIHIEENALQTEFIELLRAYDRQHLPIRGYMTKANKRALIQTLAVEVQNGLWKFKTDHFDESCPCSFCRFLKELKYYPASLSTDGIMAWLFASEASRDLFDVQEPQVHILSRREEEIQEFDLTDYEPYNRISEERGFEPPENYEKIVEYLQRLGKMPQIEDEVPFPYDDITRVWEDMQFYLKMLRGG